MGSLKPFKISSGVALQLFDFSRVARFPAKSLENLSEHDPIWALNVSRRRDALFSEPNRTSLDWYIRASEFFSEIGSFTEAEHYSNRALDIVEGIGDIDTLARLLCGRTQYEVLTGSEGMSEIHLEQMEALAEKHDRPYVKATGDYLRGFCAMNDMKTAVDDIRRAPVLYETSARLFEECGEIELAIRSRAEIGTALSRLGDYVAALTEVEKAMEFASDHGAWRQTGRLLVVAASAANDQGYRTGVEDVLRRALKWCTFTGDFYGRVMSLFTIGKLLAYSMPIGEPEAAAEPERYYRKALEEANHHGTWPLARSIQASLVWMYGKAGLPTQQDELIAGGLSVDDEARDTIEVFANHVNVLKHSVTRRISNRLQDGIEDSPDPFFVFDARRNGKGECIEFINEYRNGAGGKLLGVGPTTVLMFSEVHKNPYFDGLGESLFAAVERREVFQDVCRLELSGEGFWYRRRVVPSSDGAVLTLRDVTAEQRIEDALRKAAESAERSDRSKSEFLANMSHEIRTPIHGVLGLARLLTESPLDEAQRAHIDDIVASGDILLRVIGDILDLSKLESKSMSIDLAPVALGELVASTARLYQGQAQGKGLTLECWISADTPKMVIADGARVKQVVANLIGNAVKFTLHGSVTVTVKGENDEVVIEVRDTGIGIPAENLESVFDRFSQATAESRMLGGTGLGLTLSKGLVELMGGQIRAESKPKQGSRFIVRLPLRETSEALSNSEPDLPILFEGRRILLVDDNRVNTIVSKYALEKLDCHVSLAADGQEALAQMEAEQFDLVFMDVRMPVMNGLEATRALRQREAAGKPRTTIVALTAGALLEEREECFEAGMDDYVSKPFVGDSLRQVLARWIPR